MAANEELRNTGMSGMKRVAPPAQVEGCFRPCVIRRCRQDPQNGHHSVISMWKYVTMGHPVTGLSAIKRMRTRLLTGRLKVSTKL